MEFEYLLRAVENEPVFETGLLLAGKVDPFNIRKQLSRWTSSGKLTQLRRGLYCLAPPYRKVVPHQFLVANRLQGGSYISLQSALARYGLIPEAAPVTTSVTTGRPGSYTTALGLFDFRHIQIGWFCGYRRVDLGNDQWTVIASPEKALLDLVYLEPGGDEAAYLESLRLQSLDQLDLDLLQKLASAADKPKIHRAVKQICRLVELENSGYREL